MAALLLYIFANLLVTFAIFVIMQAFLGRTDFKIEVGLYINFFVYSAGILMPLDSLLAVFIFGAIIVFMLTLAYESQIGQKVAATALSLLFLVWMRAGGMVIVMLMDGEDGIVVYVSVAIMVLLCAIPTFLVANSGKRAKESAERMKAITKINARTFAHEELQVLDEHVSEAEAFRQETMRQLTQVRERLENRGLYSSDTPENDTQE